MYPVVGQALKPGSPGRSICRGCIHVHNVQSLISFCWMFGRKSEQEPVTKSGEVVMLSVKLCLTLVPGLGFMNLPVSRGEGIIVP